MGRSTATLCALGVLGSACGGKLVEESPSARYNAIGALDADGLVFHLAGGADRSGPQADAWALDLMHREWIRVEGPTRPLLSAASTRVGSAIWAFGGTDGDGQEVDDTVKWTVHGGTWATSAAEGSTEVPSPRREAAMVRLDAERVLLIGGNTDDDGDPGATDAEIWGLTVEDGVWTELSATSAGPSGLQRHAASHDAGIVWVHGGYDAEAVLQDHLWSLDTETWTWIEHTWTGEGPSARADHMVVASDGLVYVWGGDVDDTDVWAYDPLLGEWTAAAAGGPVGRDAFAWDRVQGEPWAIVQGGDPRDDSGYLSDVWLLDLQDLIWTELFRTDGSSF